jgi:hypothetical protein
VRSFRLGCLSSGPGGGRVGRSIRDDSGAGLDDEEADLPRQIAANDFFDSIGTLTSWDSSSTSVSSASA